MHYARAQETSVGRRHNSRGTLLAHRSTTFFLAPLVILMILPSGARTVPSVRLTVGSKGMKSSCDWAGSRGGEMHVSK